MSTLYITAADGTRTAYDVTGNGPALILIHGGGLTRQSWHETGYVDRLEDDFKVITVDVRGSGESDRPEALEAFAIETICEDIYAVADACGARQFAIWGFSFGGNIARYLGAWSERVSKVVIGGIPFGPALTDDVPDEAIQQFVESLEPEIASSASWAAIFKAMRVSWPDIEPADIRCPAMMVIGSKNQFALGNTDEEEIKRVGIRLEVFEGLNHPQEFDAIDQIFPIVLPFLKG